MAVYWGLNIATAPTPQAGAEKAGEAITYYAIPWWVKAIEFLGPIPYIGAPAIVAIVLFLAWNGRR